MIYRALDGEKLPVYGNGLNIRDWIHVKDHCSAIDFILHNGADGEIYNVGGRSEKTNIQIVKTILKILNKPETLISYVKDRAGHDLRYAIDPSKIERELGWKSEKDFDRGLSDTVAWYADNFDSWRK
jgi:dTDP-glucose 4,6-dehydratase